MSSSVVAADIHDFLRKLERDKRSGLSYQSVNYTPSSYYYQTSLLLSEPGPSKSVPAASLASSATPRSFVFDSVVDGQSVYSASTAPPPPPPHHPRQGPEPLHRQRAPIPDFSPTWLPCEFHRLSHCQERFAIEDVDVWIQHIVRDHLDGNLPPYCICWFCDQVEFRAGTDRAENYQRRMQHIASHIRHEGKTAAEVRWDFHFLDHLHHHRLVSDTVFQSATQQSELPPPRGVILLDRNHGDSRRRNARPRDPTRPHHMRRPAQP